MVQETKRTGANDGGVVMPEQNTNPFPALEGHKNADHTTFPKSSEPVATPVWYVIMVGKLYVRIAADSGKVKRIRNDGRVLLAPATVRDKPEGPTAEAGARVLGPAGVGREGDGAARAQVPDNAYHEPSDPHPRARRFGDHTGRRARMSAVTTRVYAPDPYSSGFFTDRRLSLV